jgi:GNAT superfamily N-acetyltransferase
MSSDFGAKSRFEVRKIPTSATLEVRQRVLRPTQTVADMARPEDDLPTTVHFGAMLDGRVVGTASMFFKPIIWPDGFVPNAELAGLIERCQGGAWQLRGMATTPEVRGMGAGAAVLTRCLEHVRECGGSLFWCNARLVAIGFYERFGLVAVGPEFQIQHAGTHRVMYRGM